MRKIASSLAFALLAAAAAACNNGSATLIGPDVVAVTDTFSGDIAVGGSDTKYFTTKQAGDITFTLTRDATASGTSIPLGLGVGTPTALSCNVLSTATTVLQLGTGSSTATLTTVGFGQLCIVISDAQSLGPVSYTIQVTHF